MARGSCPVRFFAVVVAGALGCGSRSGSASPGSGGSPAEPPPPAGEAVVTTDWVAQNTANPKVRVVEVSVDPGVYEKGHVPGAVGLKWHSELCDPVRRDIVTKEQFEKLCGKAGIANDTTVVLYGDNNNWFAAWAAWEFTMYGHKDVKIMNGGRVKWELEKRPWETTVPSPPPASYRVEKVYSALRARLPDVLAAVEKKEPAVLIDVRSPDEYSGKVFAPPGIQELAIRAGHVPGAKSVPWKKAVNDADGTFKSADELRKLYGDVGVTETTPVICYCRIGERSSHTWFVLRYLLGCKNVRNYDGSWTEYGNAVGVPIENEAGTVWTGK
ncbi:MAG: sulfurtransferase [Planctomycetales bacterium]|nr:sulfurtransferase [Planctomycetales bacterium]